MSDSCVPGFERNRLFIDVESGSLDDATKGIISNGILGDTLFVWCRFVIDVENSHFDHVPPIIVSDRAFGNAILVRSGIPIEPKMGPLD
jgi:hypothetical protein